MVLQFIALKKETPPTKRFKNQQERQAAAEIWEAYHKKLQQTFPVTS